MRRITHEMIMRTELVIGVMMSGLLVASCSSVSSFVADTLPPWAGGLPEGTPPRAGTPEYEAYLKSLSGNASSRGNPAPANPAPAKSETPPPRNPNESIEQPIR
jgi:hypothetical protein